jgi:hypothetical protein
MVNLIVKDTSKLIPTNPLGEFMLLIVDIQNNKHQQKKDPKIKATTLHRKISLVDLLSTWMITLQLPLYPSKIYPIFNDPLESNL